jgi:hypothetical protein
VSHRGPTAPGSGIATSSAGFAADVRSRAGQRLIVVLIIALIIALIIWILSFIGMAR